MAQPNRLSVSHFLSSISDDSISMLLRRDGLGEKRNDILNAILVGSHHFERIAHQMRLALRHAIRAEDKFARRQSVREG